MNKINIPFKGMTNVPDDSYSQDGDMEVLLNADIKNGEVVTELVDNRVPDGVQNGES